MSQLRLGDTAPDFEQESSAGPIRFHEYLRLFFCLCEPVTFQYNSGMIRQ